ncbi:type I-E CRISPR-associated protein Cas7/Cse4/CasC [Streptomyces sp. NPDC056112]|uniref:type I-E CRISPR-associated protein Cas7/Cse4/CasC n=1 Tax=Streptomyces sp. NPDC056112 TaxID=3345715 RepID=UPI0035DB174A
MAATYAPARYIDLHALHPVPASLLNRGEDDEPKTMLLGGAVRGMVSSQAWKRPIRLQLEEELDEHAARTRKLPLQVADALREDGWPDELAAFAGAQVVRSASQDGLKTEPKQGGITSSILLLAEDILPELIELCQEHRTPLEQAHAEQEAAAATEKTGKGRKSAPKVPAVLPTRTVAALIRRRTATINLFGRMLAELPGAHVDGAVQIAHAFTVHPSDPQPDYFTAVEDWPKPNEAGSAHLQTGFFTNGIFYRYATVNLTELIRNLNGDHKQALHLLGLFTEAFIQVMPGAKKTSTAPHTLPHLIHYVVRDRRPVSYAAAFEQPVQHARHGGYTLPAVQALSQHADAVNRLLGKRRRLAHGYTTIQPEPIDHLGSHHASFEDLTDALTAAAAAPSASRAGA